jgi:hypothetical protein
MEIVKGRVQYNDLKGECACDGHMGAVHHTIWKDLEMPEDYFPLALSISKWEREKVYFDIYACQKNVYGSTFDDILNKARKDGKIIVKKFEIDLTWEKFVKYAKRLNIVLRQSGIEDYDLFYDYEAEE